MTPLERVIRPIVEGQIRGFVKEHPEILKGVTWYKPRRNSAETLVGSLSKRIVRDLTCDTVIARLKTALVEGSTGSVDGTGLALTSEPEAVLSGTPAGEDR